MWGMMVVFAALALSVVPPPEMPLPGESEPTSVEEEESVARQPLKCPYGFGSQMPPGVFCVYRGTAFGPDGAPCAADVWAIWSSYSDQPRGASAEDDANRVAAGDGRAGDVAVGLLSQPEIVLRGEAERGDSNRAGFLGYFVGDDPTLHPSAGSATLHKTSDDGIAGSRLTLQFTGPEVPRYEGCSLSSYDGSLMGVLGEPGEIDRGRLVRN